ncbi:MAG: sulfatase-like hydrolase/transferase [Selenomonadaceae bacterium]|nr:sulfatase-like hydrolase/transferase [Selenomonadaceae bacterium]
MIKIKKYTLKSIGAALFFAALYFFLLMLFYVEIKQDMGEGYYLPLIAPVLLLLTFIQYASRKYLFSLSMLPNLLTGLLWCGTFPLFYQWTYNSPWYLSKICFDFVIGTGFIILLTSLETLLSGENWVKIKAAFMTALNFLLMAVPLVQIAYYSMVYHSLSPASLMALYLTNWKESINFLQSTFGYFWLAVIFAAACLTLFIFYKIHENFIRSIAKEEKSRAQNFSLAAVFVSVTLVVFCHYIPQTSIAELYKDVTDYVAKTAEYEKFYDERLNSLDIDKNAALPAIMEKPHTVIMVIGESASRSYMKAFNPKLEYDNTPWMNRMKSEGEIYLYENTYASWTQTVPSLQRALTEESQYNGKDFLKSCSVMDVAKKAGYETWWISNQGRYGEYDSIVTLIAKCADHSYWSDDSYLFSDKYDMVLLDELKKVDPKKNNFVVLHIMGSHIYYNNRYPSEFEKWQTADGAGMAEALPSYANSILYTDYFLEQVFNYAKQNLNLAAMIYFSDHGENLLISHNPDVFSFDMVRVPMMIYLSRDYKLTLPVKSDLLKSRQGRYFTNDMIYDTVAGIIRAESSRYESRQDFSSKDYGFTKDNLTTMMGERKLTEDPDAGVERFF